MRGRLRADVRWTWIRTPRDAHPASHAEDVSDRHHGEVREIYTLAFLQPQVMFNDIKTLALETAEPRPRTAVLILYTA